METNYDEEEYLNFEASSEEEIFDILHTLIHSGVEATLTVGAPRCDFYVETEAGYKLFLLEDNVEREQSEGIAITDSSMNRIGFFGLKGMPDNNWIRAIKGNNGSVKLQDIGLEWRTDSGYCHLHYVPVEPVEIGDVVTLEED